MSFLPSLAPRQLVAPALIDRNEHVYRRLLVVCAALGVALLAILPAERSKPPVHQSLAHGLCGAFVVAIVVLRLHRRALAAVVAVGAVLAALFALTHATLNVSITEGIVGGLGLGATGTIALFWTRAEGTDRVALRKTLVVLGLMPLLFLAGGGWTDQTQRLLPLVLDGYVYAMDTTLGVHAFHLGKVVAHAQWIIPACRFVYEYQWLLILAIYVRQLVDPKPKADALVMTTIAVALAITIYYVFPVIGPVYRFAKEFPFAAPSPTDGMLRPIVASPVARNCMPSMHNGWGLLLIWHARPYGKLVRAAAYLLEALTLFTTLGFGLHYVFDIIVVVPFMVAIYAATVSVEPDAARARRVAVVAGAAMTVAWLLAIRLGAGFFLRVRWISPLLAIATVAGCVPLYLSVARKNDVVKEPTADAATRVSTGVLVPILFTLTGFTGLVYEVTFSHSLGLTFGNTAAALTAVLATYMGGIAVGSWIGGRIAKRVAAPLRAYAFCEIATALLCASAPWQLTTLRDFYVRVAAGSDPAQPSLAIARMALEAAVLLPPTLLMGMTMPILVAHLRQNGLSTGRAVARLYGANTFGAALGALLTGFFILPALGVHDTTLLAVAGNLIAGLIAFLRARAGASAAPVEPPEAAADAALPKRSGSTIGFAILMTSGVVTIALETVYDHLLAVVVGNSTYAFAVMLFAFLIGLALGGSLVGRVLRTSNENLLALLGALGGALAATLLLTVFVWNDIPRYFGAFARYPFARTFAERELVRLIVCLVVSVPPTLCLGAIYTVAIAVAAGNDPRASAARVGVAGALNAVGNVAGALVAGVVLLPTVGSLRTIQALALLAATLLVPAFWKARRGNLGWLGAVTAAVVLALAVQPSKLDVTRLSNGANVYFNPTVWGTVIDYAESRDGGLTSVARAHDSKHGDTLTLLTNGKFQGNDTGERTAQYSFALYPLIHTAGRERALVIGYGTGATSRVMADAGFGRVDIAELSADIVRLADAHFVSINHRASQSPNARLHVTDGRNFLLLSRDAYDVISIEISSIWFRGAASLYNREFYELARARLAPGGVLQQWVQLHHIAVRDVFSIIATMHSVFPKVTLYFRGGQGILIGSVDDRPPSAELYERTVASPGIAEIQREDRVEYGALVASTLLAPAGTDRMLADWERLGVPLASIVSDDDNMMLEYSTPAGNVLDAEVSTATVIEALAPYSPVNASRHNGGS